MLWNSGTDSLNFIDASRPKYMLINIKMKGANLSETKAPEVKFSTGLKLP